MITKIITATKSKVVEYSLCLFSIFFLTTLTGCDFIYHLIDKEGAQEKEIIGEISPLEPSPIVKEVQQLLQIYGYNPGSDDGVLGPQTRVKLEVFQKDAGLKQTRYIDRATLAKLREFKTYQLIVGDKPNIKLIQEILKTAGFNPGAVDGHAGAQTKQAIIAFQKANGLSTDGKIDYRTLSKMKEYLVFE